MKVSLTRHIPETRIDHDATYTEYFQIDITSRKFRKLLKANPDLVEENFDVLEDDLRAEEFIDENGDLLFTGKRLKSTPRKPVAVELELEHKYIWKQGSYLAAWYVNGRKVWSEE